MWIKENVRPLLEQYKLVATSLMERHGYRLLRISMGIIFIWFGALKPLGLSPAEALVAKATAWIPIPGFLYILTAWEIAIGVCFLFEGLVGYAVVLLFLHMPGTLLPLITLRDETFVRFPFALTLEGQYIVKNLVLIAAGMVIGGRLKPSERIDDPTRLISAELYALHVPSLARGEAGEPDPSVLPVRESWRESRDFS